MSRFFIIAILFSAFTLPFPIYASSSLAGAKQSLKLQEGNSCNLSLSGLTLPPVKEDVNGLQYLEFDSFQHATEFLEHSYRATRQNLEDRLPLILPTMNGLYKLLRANHGNIDVHGREKGRLTGGIVMMLNSLDQMSIIHPDADALYDIIIRITGSAVFAPLDNGINLSDFSSVYFNLKRSPPEKQMKQWIRSFPIAINKVNNPNKLENALELLTFPTVDEKTRKALAKTWLQRERLLEDSWEDTRLIHALNYLLLIHPESALSFCKRHRSQFRLIDLNNHSEIIRPLAYFKYVFNESVPDFDHDLLRAAFEPDEDHESSRLELLVQNWLEDLGQPAIPNKLDPFNEFLELDLRVPTSESRFRNVEVDGPHHYIIDEFGNSHQRLQDKRRDEILVAMAQADNVDVEVYRISYLDLLTEEDREAQQLKLIEHLLQ